MGRRAVSGPLVTPVTRGGTSNTRAQGELSSPYARKGVTGGDGVTPSSGLDLIASADARRAEALQPKRVFGRSE